MGEGAAGCPDRAIAGPDRTTEGATTHEASTAHESTAQTVASRSAAVLAASFAVLGDRGEAMIFMLA